MTLPTGALRVSLNFSPGAEETEGTIDIPQQNARGLRLADVRTVGNSAHFAIQGVPGEPRFQGTFSADRATLAGSFQQAGQAYPFRLQREPQAAEAAGAALEGIEAVIVQGNARFHRPRARRCGRQGGRGRVRAGIRSP